MNKVFNNLDPEIKTKAYDTYWKFACERQNVFFNRLENEYPWTHDPILEKYKFTNAYRACDRVSQYLLRNVIYTDEKFSAENILFRIILFKLFNKIETWELLKERFSEISVETIRTSDAIKYLDSEMNRGRILYSNAYMMASGSKEFNVPRKHHAHFYLLEMMLKDRLVSKLQDCNSMQEGYQLLLEYPLIGNFLAYQYITDINYSEIVNFSESEFTVPGPGARDGIRKCFQSLGGLTETDIIKLMTDRQEYEFERLNLNFRKIGNRNLQYIDIQNIFCETDKYCRIAHPDLSGISGRTRIKQLFKETSRIINYIFPPKWNVKLKSRKL